MDSADSSDESDPSGATLSYRNILEREMENALREMDRPLSGLFLSGVSAGLNLSFGALFMALVLTLSGGFDSALVRQTALAAASSVAFLFVVVGQTELFTAHSTLGVLPVLDGRSSTRDLGRLWAVTYASNLVGCAVFSVLLAGVVASRDVVSATAFGTLAGALVPLSWWAILLSGVLAGWLMGLVTWLSAASRDTIGRAAFVLLGTGAIGFGPFHHSILGTTEVLTALLLGQGITAGGFGHFLLWTTLGNVVGGTVFVGLLNYGHVALVGRDVDLEPEEEA
ncbi:formate/nitrite transporter family protein [Halorarum halobium]|uniref:formate/nitrite transporter family protein n=1 Tax=Halorarum halobium TaxID=3075121 RepID=UPI0028B261C0|nr:formate/nitrite transporter family protein [Halobaculum sp. XH14]